MEDERLDRADPVSDECRDVPVAAELAQQGLRVPEHEVGCLGPGEAGVPGEQRAAPRTVRQRARRPARASSAARAISADSIAVAEHPSQRGVRGHRAAPRARPPVARSPTPAGIAARTSAGAKLKKVATTVSAATAPIGRRPRGEVAGLRGEAEVRVGRGRLGGEVDHPVERLEGPPGLAGGERGGGDARRSPRPHTLTRTGERPSRPAGTVRIGARGRRGWAGLRRIVRKEAQNGHVGIGAETGNGSRRC